MPTTYVDYTATAAQTDFAFSFDYLEDEHVVVEIDGSATTDFSIVTSPSTKVVLNSGATVGQKVRVRRKSQPDTNLVDFENGSVLTESELDRAYLHNRYLNEEIAELNDASLQKEVGSDSWDAKSQKMVNLADPTEAQDAATKNYVDTNDALKVNKAGDSMTGALAMGSNKITGLDAPTDTTDATTKTYVDNKVNQASTGTSFPPTKWVFTGTAGASTTYSVTGAEVNGDTAYDVSIDGAVKEPTTDFTVDPDTDTLTIVPTLSGGEDIVVIERGFGVAITTGTIGSSQISATANNVLLGNDNGTNQDVQELTAAEARTLLDFDTEVANNTAVAANTAKVGLTDNSVTSARISDTDTQFLVDDTSSQKTVVVNEGGADVDFRVEGDSDQNLLFCEGSSDKVLIGDTSADEDAKFSVVGNGSAVIQSLENKSTTGLAALVVRAATPILQLKDDQASVDSGTFNIQSAGDKLEIELISDDGLTATTLLDLDASGNSNIIGTVSGTNIVESSGSLNQVVRSSSSANLGYVIMYSGGEALNQKRVNLVPEGGKFILSWVNDDTTAGLAVRLDQATGAWEANSDNAQNLGSSSFRWAVVYAGTGSINTSDRNEKEEIEDLSEAELRVATALKGLIKKFKFKGRVRKHIGVIAQDVEAAFTTEGLNASDYGLFCSDTFEDENGNTVTRLGVRYEELLAFIIAAM